MTAEQYAQSIQNLISKQALDTVSASLATAYADADKLREEIAALKAKYEPKLEETAKPS